MGDNSHTLTKKSSKFFVTEREVPHIRIGDETVLQSRYSREQKLGQGTFGIVYQGVNVDTKEVVAIKIVNRDKAGSSNIKLLEREIGILKTVNHEHIIRLNEVYETTNKIFLIMEYCNRGELSELLRACKRMDEATVKIILKRLASAMAYLHINGIVHRDLKMENILVGTNPNDPNDQFFIKVTDFGLSVVRGGMGPESMLSSFCGTPAYMAPEIILNKSYSETCDNWSIGCITFALLTGQLPFYSKEDDKLYDAIKNSDPDWRILPKGTSNDAKHCLRKLLSKDPANRMTAGELLRHPWITGEAGSATPNVLDLMHDFLKQNIQDEDAIPEEKEPSDPSPVTAKESETKPKSSGSRGSSSGGGIRVILGGESPVAESSSDSNNGNSSGNTTTPAVNLVASPSGSMTSRTPTKLSTTPTLKKSPSENEFDSSGSSQTGPSKKHNTFDTSLPASAVTKNMFSNQVRYQSAAVSTPRQPTSKGNTSSSLSVPKPPAHSNSSSNLSTKSNGGNGSVTSSSFKANKKT